MVRFEGSKTALLTFPGAYVLESFDQVRSIVFDLDGTLYKNSELADAIVATADELVAHSRGLGLKEARKLIHTARKRLSETYDDEPTLTRTCMELGIEARQLHEAFQQQVRPERYLVYDPVLQALLDSLRGHCNLYIYTNNNLPLTNKILALLGVEELFDRLYTIEFTWLPKPDRETLFRIVEDIGGPPESFLFVGDRPGVDLREPERLGASVLQVDETADLLQIHKLLGLVP